VSDPLSGVADEVRIVEVGARDGLQNEAVLLPVEARIALIRDLAAAGLRTVEAGAFVRFDLVPAMAGTDAVLAGLRDLEGVRLPVLVPNRRGLRLAIDAGALDVALFAAASETFSLRNGGAGIDATLERLDEVAAKARTAGIKLRGYISCVAGCPFEGDVPVQAVVRVAEAMVSMGCTEVSLGDTTGVGTPRRIAEVVRACAEVVGLSGLAIHAHDTFGQALANVLTALELGVRAVDASVAGLGGCPFAPGAAGNLATEDLVYMLDGMGVRHGVDMDRLIRAGEAVTSLLGHAGHSRAATGFRKRKLAG
jgi:hydroxymethylglutaryl-CoA lyase